ncbi:uncharacterized protein LOC126109448 [Schistocerca cancellata]|uniref:uncharacterized protein LOC126109448 n=1 Tax=Schistocerca cancellata TaxID=274614 RepID=UPI00211941BB|nr:uncharacterized protein LOC126109448 [Schistocerca cancellata]
MGPKKKEHSVALRERVLLLHPQGRSYRQTGAEVSVSYTTVRDIIHNNKETGTTVNKCRPGRPKVLTTRERRRIIALARKEPATSATTIAEVVQTASDKTVSVQTILNVLNEGDIHGRSPRKKPYISEINRHKRLQFVKDYISKLGNV